MAKINVTETKLVWPGKGYPNPWVELPIHTHLAGRLGPDGEDSPQAVLLSSALTKQQNRRRIKTHRINDIARDFAAIGSHR